ncbi:DAK2 domain-containing protein [Thermoanaerobacter uzonensis]|uniref:DAK2 domain-containing protein n=1 Tax=Thermoanaerobacter uzonensis TaxID=447593 RepID=UPI003D766A68
MGNLYLDSEKLYFSFISGAYKVIQNKNILNEINVFPVADSDTGNNLASTMNSIIRNSKVFKSIKATMNNIADAALIGARGNSGIIIAQYINGIAENLKEGDKIDVHSFAEALKNAVPYAYNAISNPVEGTIITVINDWAESICKYKEVVRDFYELFSMSMETALRSLSETTSKLKALEYSKVVDSGAKGFVFFLEGFMEFLKTGELKDNSFYDIEKVEFSEEAEHDLEKITNRFCTEALIKGKGIDVNLLKKQLKPYGDSIIVAGNERMIRVHIHTNKPEEVFYFLKDKGEIIQQKVDDMVRQYEVSHKKKYNIALVTDSIADLPKEIMDLYQIHMIPLELTIDGTTYLDKKTINSQIFYKLLNEALEYPKSTQPNYKLVVNYFKFLTNYYDEIIVITVSSEQSGTYNVFKKASQEFVKKGKRIEVIDSKQNSAAEGLLVIKAAELIHEGYSFDEITKIINEQIKKTKILVSFNTLKYIIKSGRLSKTQGIIAKIINLKPIASLDENGRGVVIGKAFSEKGNIKSLMKIIKKCDANNKVLRYAISHASNYEKAKKFEELGFKFLGKRPEYIIDISAIGVSTAGIGTVAVAYMWDK